MRQTKSYSLYIDPTGLSGTRATWAIPGGVFAHLVGTLDLLSASEQKRIVGFVINRFRGDLSLLQPGLDWLESRTGKPVLGVLSYLSGLHLDAEDALPRQASGNSESRLRIIAPALPRISNATDCDPLRLHPELSFRFVGPGETILPADLIGLPGSKSVQADLAWLSANGWEHAIRRHLRYGGKLIGICGGLQMLGRALHDPLGLEGTPGSAVGLGLLDLETTLAAEKQLKNVSGTLTLAGDAELQRYEIHMGVSHGLALARPSAHLDGRADGAVSDDGRILASYVHGLFDTPAALSALLAWASPTDVEPFAAFDLAARRDTDINRLADSLEEHLDWQRLAEWLPAMRA